MTDTVDLLAIERGSITAPAGCGKTRLIADSLQHHRADKPVLVLTHTNAGVGALRRRLAESGVSPSRYRLYTIDGWTMKLIATFPGLSGHKPEILLANVDYPAIRSAASQLSRRVRIGEMLGATYSHLFVDEYQDCSTEQHGIIKTLSEHMPTAVLGDHMQAIFAFRGASLVDWKRDVESWFDPAGKLSTPWRWINAGTETLGTWLLDVRGRLERGESIDVRGAPSVNWVAMRNNNDHEMRRKAAAFVPPTSDGGVLIIGNSKSPASQRDLARGVYGATTVEAVDLRDLIGFATHWDCKAPGALDALVNFAGELTRGVDVSALRARIRSIQKGTARLAMTAVEQLSLEFIERPSHAAASALLDAIRSNSSAHPHRPIVLRAFQRALRASTDSRTLLEAALRERDRNRLLGRPPAKREVGSTLLLKGLEAAAVVIIDAHTLDRKNLYVAMTRGSHSVVVCSPTPVLSPVA